jgi:hypothetical protein
MKLKHLPLFLVVLSGPGAVVAQVTLNTVPIRIIGHPKPEGLTIASANPNLVEGRELFGPTGGPGTVRPDRVGDRHLGFAAHSLCQRHW